MDWAENEELEEIFLTEVDARAATLVAGARDLVQGSLQRDLIEDLVRDAHTVKGSAAMMERRAVSDAAARLEAAWTLAGRGAIPAPVLGSALLELAAALPDAARTGGPMDVLEGAVGRLDDLLTNGRSPNNAPEKPKSPYGLAQAAPMKRAGSEIDPASVDRRRTDLAASLGGLLPTLQSELDGAVARVDSGGLYALINRIVELGIDVDALEDLTMVEFDRDQGRLFSAWRQQIGRLASETRAIQADAVALVNIPFFEALDSFNQFVKFLGRRLQKSVRFEIEGADIMVDRQIVELLREPLRHVVVNSVDHGIESSADRLLAGKTGSGTIRLEAALDDDRLLIRISDDGRGIDWDAVEAEAQRQGLPTNRNELQSHLLRPEFSATHTDTEFSGVGDGLSVVADAVDRVSGSIAIESVAGRGTVVSIEVPGSLLLQRVITVNAGGNVVGMIEAAVIGFIDLDPTAQSVQYRSESIPVLRLSSIIGGGRDDERTALVTSTRHGLVAVGITEILGERRLAVKNLGPILGGADHIAGAAFLGGGEILVVIDHHHLGKLARQQRPQPERTFRVMVVDDSSGVRQLLAATLRGHGFEVEVASDAELARDRVMSDSYDALVVDYAMPGSNGAEFVADLRSMGLELPIVMVSGVASEEQKASATAAGVDVYLDKYDFRQGALIDSISALLSTGVDDV